MNENYQETQYFPAKAFAIPILGFTTTLPTFTQPTTSLPKVKVLPWKIGGYGLLEILSPGSTSVQSDLKKLIMVNQMQVAGQ